MPHAVLSKTMRVLATRKREFLKIKKNLITQQASVLSFFLIWKINKFCGNIELVGKFIFIL